MLLKKRGIGPARLRDVRYDDVKRLLRSNRIIRRKLPERFIKRFEDPAYRKRLKINIRNGGTGYNGRWQKSGAPPNWVSSIGTKGQKSSWIVVPRGKPGRKKNRLVVRNHN